MNKFGLFCCGQYNYAVPFEYLKKILQRQPISRLPLACGESISVLIDDEVAVPLVDLAQLVVGRGSCEPDYQVLLNSRRGTLALFSDVPGRITAKGEALSVNVEDPHWISGKYSYLGTDYAILNIEALILEMTGHLESR